jgi:hypothetical protein
VLFSLFSPYDSHIDSQPGKIAAIVETLPRSQDEIMMLDQTIATFSP